MAGKKETPPKKVRATKKSTQPKASSVIQIDGDVKGSNVILGDHTRIDQRTTIHRTRNFTNIIQNARPRDYILYTSIFLFVLVIVGYFFWYNNLRYDRAIASGHLNVLIVPFVEKHAWGYGKSDLGWNVAQVFADGMEKSFTKSGIDTNIKILGPSDKIPTIFGFNESQLGRSAETISERINGQIVVYGIISQDEYGDSVVNVRVYISPTNFGEAQELISDSMMGELSLGSFRLTGDTISGVDLLAQNKELRDRLDVFSSIINFLGAYLGEDFDRAETYIEKAGDQSLWGNTNGLEVVYLIQGNMEIRRARVMMVNKDLQGTLETIEQAMGYFNEATNVSIKNGNGRYARAYLGLAGAEGLRAIAEANIQGKASLIDTDALDRSLKYLEEATLAEYRPETADVSVKANYSKAQTALAFFAKTGNAEYLLESKKYYETVVDEYHQTDNKRIAEFAALSQSGLGHIAANNMQIEVAVNHFLSAQEITSNPSLKAQCLVNVGDVYFANNEYDKALKYYQDALLRRSDLEKAVLSERILEIEERINLIKNGGSL